MHLAAAHITSDTTENLLIVFSKFCLTGWSHFLPERGKLFFSTHVCFDRPRQDNLAGVLSYVLQVLVVFISAQSHPIIKSCSSFHLDSEGNFQVCKSRKIKPRRKNWRTVQNMSRQKGNLAIWLEKHWIKVLIIPYKSLTYFPFTAICINVSDKGYLYILWAWIYVPRLHVASVHLCPTLTFVLASNQAKTKMYFLISGTAHIVLAELSEVTYE